MNKYIFLLGFLLIILGVIFMIFGLLIGEHEVKTEYGGVIIIGPFPIVFASNKNLALILILFSIFVLLFYLILLKNLW